MGNTLRSSFPRFDSGRECLRRWYKSRTRYGFCIILNSALVQLTCLLLAALAAHSSLTLHDTNRRKTYTVRSNVAKEKKYIFFSVFIQFLNNFFDQDESVCVRTLSRAHRSIYNRKIKVNKVFVNKKKYTIFCEVFENVKK